MKFLDHGNLELYGTHTIGEIVQTTVRSTWEVGKQSANNFTILHAIITKLAPIIHLALKMPEPWETTGTKNPCINKSIHVPSYYLCLGLC